MSTRSAGPTRAPGAFLSVETAEVDSDVDPDADTDGDGLLDTWEINGVNGVDLPAMGADPNRPDIFLEIDYMATAFHSHQPTAPALEAVIAAFLRQDISLHIDAGPNVIMIPEFCPGDDPNPSEDPATPCIEGDMWGSRSRADQIPEDLNLGSFNFFGKYRW